MIHGIRWFPSLVAVTVAGCLLVPLIWAQEPPADAPQSPADAYKAKYEEWVALVKELRRLQTEYQNADDSAAPEIEKKWYEVLDQGRAMIPELGQAAKQAYLASPNTDRELTRFLFKLAFDAAQRDDYEMAADLAQPLIDHESGIREAYVAAGVAAFGMNDFDKADEYLKIAKDLNASSELEYEKFLDATGPYKEFWAKEQEIREKEATANDLPRVKIATSKGDIVVELFENEAPQTVGNFVHLVEDGFYDGLTFHRVLPNFMAQGGCPRGDGTGGPGYMIYDECNRPDHRKHFRGSLSMAHSGPNTGGSQFFITFLPTAHLNELHTVFGRVIEGMEVLAKLRRINPEEALAATATPDKIVKMEVLRKRDHAYVPTKVEE